MKGRAIGAGFGLLVFLISIAISMWMWGTYTAEVSKHGMKAEEQARQFAGRDDRGRPAVKSVSLVPEEQNGKLKYVLVESVERGGTYGGTYETWFKLQQNDAIIAVGPMELRDEDWEMAYALIQDAYRLQQDLIVIRGGKKIVLPEGRVLDDSPSLAIQVNSTPATQPAPQTSQNAEERVVPKELGPLRGIIR
jgi:hypothetical protein